MKKTIVTGASLLLSMLLTASSCAQQDTTTYAGPKPTNVILLIGDGMGLAQVSTIYYGDVETVHFDRFTNTGFIKTWSSRQKVTDSAAGATAFSAGVKTYNGAIGVNDDEEPVETIVERAEDLNIDTGIIATSSITHATPASFFAHVRSRNLHEDIAGFLPESGVDFFAGGGLKFFTQRADGQDLFEALQESGFVMDSTAVGQPIKLSANEKYGYLLAEDAMPTRLEGRGSFLREATKRALDYFSNRPDGFFMMVEGSQIDWGGHDNDYEYLAAEVEDFNETLGLVLDYAKDDGNTLVVVTADHETGGLALAGGQGYTELAPSFSTGGHTATLIPVFAFGPGAELFNGIYQNNDIYHKIVAATGW